MHIDLTRGGSKSLPKQIGDTIGHRIESGLLAPGSRLASVRRLAVTLGVSQMTVSKAYGELERRGLIECLHGKGCYVRETEASLGMKLRGGAAAGGAESGKKAGRGADGGQGRVPDTLKGGKTDGRHGRELPDYLPRAQLWHHFNSSSMRCPFHVAAIHADLLPLGAIGRHMASLVLEHPELMADYGNFQGDAELRAVMSTHLAKRGIHTPPEELLITSGAQQGIDLVARTFVGPGDAVYVEGPSYTGAIDVLAGRGADIITVPMDGEGMKLDALTRMCDDRPPKLIYTVPTFQNPSGLTLSLARRRQLLDLARSYRCLIVEDDPFSDLFFDNPPPPPIKSLDDEGTVVYMKSFSKVLAPGSRLAAVAAGRDILARLIAAKSATDLGSPLLTQRALLPFIAGEYEAHAARLRTALRRRRDKAASLLKLQAPEGLRWLLPGGGLNLWLELPRGCSIPRLARRTEQEGVSFLPGAVCFAGEGGQQHVRICYARTTEEDLECGLQVFLRALDAELEEVNGRT
ncbi:PLP-dependent aminotransferase family protein [Paenibacillus sp. CN-4]|uniref:aminotransferase-like domain-containing protein n=1 Tax=Paenibacillus nanchangensis TaxID=3348343 RepID=UPI00397B1F23